MSKETEDKYKTYSWNELEKELHDVIMYLHETTSKIKKSVDDLEVKFSKAMNNNNHAESNRLAVNKQNQYDRQTKFENLIAYLEYLKEYKREEKIGDHTKHIQFITKELNDMKESLEIFYHDMPIPKKACEVAIDNFEKIIELIDIYKY